MNFKVARAEGERVVSELLRKFRQDTGNAKWIGKFALSRIEERFAGASETGSSSTSSSVASAEVSSSLHHVDSLSPAPLSAWSILSASELIEYVQTCSEEDAQQILAEERLKLHRAAVLEAAARRLNR
jgi:hypothetical protein